MGFLNMFDVGLLMLYLLIIFSVCGIHLWSGVLHQRCSNHPEFLCSTNSWIGGLTCPNGSQCILDEQNINPVEGLIGFDHFGTALLTIFVVSTLEDWSPIMYDLTDASGYCWFLFVIIIMLSSLYSVTLVIGIMLDEIAEVTKEMAEEIEAENKRQELKRAQRHSGTRSSLSGESITETTGNSLQRFVTRNSSLEDEPESKVNERKHKSVRSSDIISQQ